MRHIFFSGTHHVPMTIEYLSVKHIFSLCGGTYVIIHRY
jgi:hypothetical protein